MGAIYTTRLKKGVLVMLVIYAKSAQDNIPAHLLKQIAEDNGQCRVKKELLERNSQRNIGEELLSAIRDVKAGRYGESYSVEPNQIISTRMKCGLSQTQFAKALHISPRTLQQWEQGRRHPSGAAETLLKIVAKHPEVLLEVMVQDATALHEIMTRCALNLSQSSRRSEYRAYSDACN